MGIERSFQAMADADVTLVVLDRSAAPEAEDQRLIERARSTGRALVAANKSDLPPAFAPPAEAIPVSALTGDGIARLRQAILEAVAPAGAFEPEAGFIASLRHEQLLRECGRWLEKARGALGRDSATPRPQMRGALLALPSSPGSPRGAASVRIGPDGSRVLRRVTLKWCPMRLAIQILAYAVDLPLQTLVVAALLRGSWRRFPMVLALSVVELVSALVQAPGTLQTLAGHRPPGLAYETVYWYGATIDGLLLYSVVISLLYRACERLRSARPTRVALIVGACLVAGGTLLAHYNPLLQRGLWLTPWFRDLNFACMWMNFVLFASLLAARNKDRQLLLLSGGLGVEYAGDAIGESLRQMAIRSRSHPLSLTGAVVMLAAGAFRYYAWWRALRRQSEKKAPSALARLRPHGSA